MQQYPRFSSFFRKVTTIATKCKTSESSSFQLLRSNSAHNSTSDAYYGNRRIDDFIKSGHLNDAHKLFDEMHTRDAVSYNLIISGFGRYGRSEQAFSFYNKMVSEGTRESASTFSSVIGICADAGFHQEGIQIHGRVISLGFRLNLFIGSSLVDLYLQMGMDDLGLQLFVELPERNVALWNVILRGFSKLGLTDKLLRSYQEMELDGVEPNGLSFCYLIGGCTNQRLHTEGKQLHCRVIRLGWVESNVFLANALVDFYSACGNLADAKKSFAAIPIEDVISWNSMISIFSENGLLIDSLTLFNRMHFWGKRPSVRSFVAFLNASSHLRDILFGMQVHSFVLKLGFDCGNVYVQSALINMYGKCGDIGSSVSVYESVPQRTIESCNSLITCLQYSGSSEDVFEMFVLMVDEGIGVDEVTISTALKSLSVSSIASSSRCGLLHCVAVKSGLESDVAVACSLIDVYLKCGRVELSRKVFEKVPSPSLYCFTSIIGGYARNGMGRESIEMLEEMVKMGMNPDEVTFLSIISGCNHSGLVEEGKFVFNLMSSFYGIHPERKHYSCMIDLLGRAGQLEEAEELLRKAYGTGNGDAGLW